MRRFWKKKQKVIIGIHGVGNKPPERILRHWWKKSIDEGLKRIGHPHLEYFFELVYWAHFLYSEPQQLKIRERGHPLRIDDPYVPGPRQRAKSPPSQLRKKILNVVEKVLDKVFLSEHRLINFDFISDYVIRKKFRDLDLYYHNANVGGARPGFHARSLIRLALANTLRKHENDDILLIAHSMGSIVAYDVLTQETPNIDIHTFITLGSPLGLPTILKRFFVDQKKDFRIEKQAPSPENIRWAWYNFADLEDRVAINYTLADDFAKNKHGVGPQDIIVSNDYEFEGERNHHKAYGYLRAPEVAEIIYQFLTETKPSPFEKAKQKLRNFLRRSAMG